MSLQHLSYDPHRPTDLFEAIRRALTPPGHRAWGLPAIVALSVFVVSLTASAFATLECRGVPRRPVVRRNQVLWPLLGLGAALAICTLLDEHLPEFGR